jgi:RsmE family RNA methyltransferase
LRANGFTLVDLGPRVLRTETASIAALSIVRAKLGLM